MRDIALIRLPLRLLSSSPGGEWPFTLFNKALTHRLENEAELNETKQAKTLLF